MSEASIFFAVVMSLMLLVIVGMAVASVWEMIQHQRYFRERLRNREQYVANDRAATQEMVSRWIREIKGENNE